MSGTKQFRGDRSYAAPTLTFQKLFRKVSDKTECTTCKDGLQCVLDPIHVALGTMHQARDENGNAITWKI